MALAFLPPHEVQDSYMRIQNTFQNLDPVLNEFFAYFQRTWFANVSLWNIHKESIWTNNDLEGWHGRVSRSFRTHPDIFTFLQFLKSEEHFTKHLILQSNIGTRIKRFSKKSAFISHILEQMISEYLSGKMTKFEFLKSCSLAIKDFNLSTNSNDSNLSKYSKFPELTGSIFEDSSVFSAPNSNSFDVAVLSDPSIPDIVFQTLSSTWQMCLCSLLGLQIVCNLYSDLSLARQISAFHPPTAQPVIGDGNCLFRAICYPLTGSEDMHLHLRGLICDVIEQNSHFLSVPQDYIQTSNMRISGVWGTEVEIFAIASLLRCNIYVYSSFGTLNNVHRWLRFEPNLNIPSHITPTAYSFYLNHYNQNHYEPVLSVL